MGRVTGSVILQFLLTLHMRQCRIWLGGAFLIQADGRLRVQYCTVGAAIDLRLAKIIKKAIKGGLLGIQQMPLASFYF